MGEQYFYQLDGLELGPFSNDAVKLLIAGGKLQGALIRDEDPVWRTQEELGFTPFSTGAIEPKVQQGQKQEVDIYGFPISNEQASREGASRPAEGVQSALPEGVRISLKKYSRHETITCLECGYTGPAGVKKTRRPWYLSWWVVLLAIALAAPFGSFVWWIPVTLGCVAVMTTIMTMECPSCRRAVEGRRVG